jgi:hypothetical protein
LQIVFDLRECLSICDAIHRDCALRQRVAYKSVIIYYYVISTESEKSYVSKNQQDKIPDIRSE